MGRAVERVEVGHRVVGLELAHETAEYGIARIPQRHDDRSIREQARGQAQLDDVERQLVDQPPRRRRTDGTLGVIPEPAPRLVRFGRPHRPDAGGIGGAAVPLEQPAPDLAERAPLARGRKSRMGPQHGFHQRRARARKADEEDRRGPLVSAGDAFPAGHPLTREVGAVAAQSLHVALGICTLRLGKLRLPRIGATESGEGRVRIAQAIIGLTKLELGVRRDRRAGPAGQELLQPRPRFLEPSRAVVEDGRNQVADGVAGALSQHAPGHLPRLVERVHGLERDGQRGRPIERVRAERDGSAQQVDRFLRPALEPQHPAQVVERAKMVGIERQGPVICVLGRLVPARPREARRPG